MQLTLLDTLIAVDVHQDVAVVKAPLSPQEWARWRSHVLQLQKLPDGQHWALKLKPGTPVSATEPSHGSQSLSNQVDPWQWVELCRGSGGRPQPRHRPPAKGYAEWRPVGKGRTAHKKCPILSFAERSGANKKAGQPQPNHAVTTSVSPCQ